MARTRFKVFDNSSIDLYNTNNATTAQIKNFNGRVLLSGHNRNRVYCGGSGDTADILVSNFIQSGKLVEYNTTTSNRILSTSFYQFEATTTDATPLEFAKFTLNNKGVYNFEGDALVYCTSESAPTGEAEFGAYLQFNTTYKYRAGFLSAIPSDEVVIKQNDFSSGTLNLTTSSPTSTTLAFQAVGLANRNLTWVIDIKRKEITSA